MSYNAKVLRKKYQRICNAKRNPFLSPDFSMEEFGLLLGVNRTYVSQFVNTEFGMSFHYLVRSHRLEHAEKLMREHPEMKLLDVLHASGFANDTSFRRAYKDKHGRLPSADIRALRE